ncbi:GNAT family N-acetyltransferase [Pseudalkalibacillus caeni]|uniref:GNAT family N-acetyltransferase n=1 Tax=Exobacillus caeni TaxID=2574798 RepID=A0A5R9F5F9_9BACL|nr:GNAT family N-acetyltransferase [Pseudalkalibacillus caeni]TLS38757.1 GNAT family N-acetyltransferase [Pseudalkalibacillus caeni]
MLTYETIKLPQDNEVITRFRKDSFIVSFGNADDLKIEEYIRWVEQKASEYPDGFVLVKKNGETVGQLELQAIEYEEKRIGYVNLFYLKPEYRGAGFGSYLMEYARRFFQREGVSEFHLRVSSTNEQAVRYYQKHGMKQIKQEFNGKVIRMEGTVSPR